ncbi:MAG: hypothetical protein IPK68_00715 [Bdellovibrionales bacterium]|nr:hypothetical protein [Bdellovibrionales bacterium]
MKKVTGVKRQVWVSLVAVSSMVLLSFSCTRKNSNMSKISLALPSYKGKSSGISKISSPLAKQTKSTNAMASKMLNAQSEGGIWEVEDATDISEIACYAVFVGGPGLDYKSCKNSEGIEVVRFGREAGIFKPGQNIELDVPSGNGRRIFLIGFKTDDTTTFEHCHDIFGTQASPPKGHLSAPLIVGQTTLDLVPGNAEVNIVASLSGSKKFEDCSFFQGGGSGGGGNTPLPPVAENLFGDGGDGDLVITSTGPSQSNTSTYGFFSSYTPGYRALPSNKIFGASRRIVGIDSTGLILSTNSSFTSYEFEIGDEILFHVASGRSLIDPDLNACGGGLHRGDFQFARVANVPNSTTIEVDHPIAPIPAAINNSNLSASISFSGYFCHIQIIRVPNFNQINVQPGAVHQMLSGTYNWGDVTGLTVFRAKNLVLNSSSTLSIKSVGSGFNATAFSDGGSLSGPGGSSGSASTNGGGNEPGSGGAGGGGSAVSSGGDGGGNSGSGGYAVDYCIGPCSIYGGKKIMYGGAGGGVNTVAGGSGGGGLLLFIGNVEGSGLLELKAGGSQGSSDRAGGGAGGTPSLISRNSFKP